jgi:DNA repair exonuclease SbcCD nuclease subunit
MSQPALRLVHASDLHLERPLYGLAEIPDHLREMLRDAPYRAATQVFDTALTENADGVLLAGDVVDIARAGPRAIVFLREQFERLRAREITVYWAGGVCDPPDAWPPAAPLPENVVVFPVGRVEQHELKRKGEIIARVQGTSAQEGGVATSTGFHRDANGRFTVGVAYGSSAAPGREGDRVHYMALGGRHRRTTVDTEPGIAHYCGTTQGRCPDESGPSGCTVVQVDEQAQAKTRFVATDCVRWIDETLEVTATTTREKLLERLDERLDKLRAKSQGVDLLVTWIIRGAGPLVNELRPGGITPKLLTELRGRAGRLTPAIWSVDLQSEAPAYTADDWHDQDNILGDLLRQFKQFHQVHELGLALDQFLPDGLREKSLLALGEVAPGPERESLLDEATKFGLDLVTTP